MKLIEKQSGLGRSIFCRVRELLLPISLAAHWSNVGVMMEVQSKLFQDFRIVK